MPYSKNPRAYPPEMEQMLLRLPQMAGVRFTFPCGHPSEARSRKVMIQSYFAAVRRHAKELEDICERLRQKTLTSTGASYVEDHAVAKAIAADWREKAQIATEWMVTAEGHEVVVSKRKLAGAFAAGMEAFLATPVAPPPTEAEKAVDLEEQMRLFALAKAQMTQSNAAGGAKTD